MPVIHRTKIQGSNGASEYDEVDSGRARELPRFNNADGEERTVTTENSSYTNNVGSTIGNNGGNDEDFGAQMLERSPDDNAVPTMGEYTAPEILLTTVSIIFYLFDTGSDCYLAVEHFCYKRWTYFGLTLLFVLGPHAAVAIMDIFLNHQDGHLGKIGWNNAICYFFGFLFAPLRRYYKVLRFGLKSRKSDSRDDRDESYQRMREEEGDGAFFGLIERYLEATPQLTLQIVFIIHHTYYAPQKDFNAFMQYASCILSWLSVSWSVTAYNHTARTSVGCKGISLPGRFIQFLWHAGTIGSRIWAIALVASIHYYVMFGVCLIHFLVVWTILTFLHQRASRPTPEETTSSEQFREERQIVCRQVNNDFTIFILSMIHVFVPVNTLDEEPTVEKNMIFYMVCLLENIGFIAYSLLVVLRSEELPVCPIELLWISIGSFALYFLGLFFMALYYGKFHPTMTFDGVQDAFNHMFRRTPPSQEDL